MTDDPRGPSFDRGEVARKYAEERDRRMVEARGKVHDLEHEAEFAKYLADPFTPFQERAPISDDIDVAIIGAGIAGVVNGAKLRDQGDFRIRLIDTAGGVGGTWYWNRYPGVMCDVESYIYMPMLEEMDYVPRDRYASGDEIRSHLDRIAQKYDLLDDALFHTRVIQSAWDEGAARWVVTTDRGDEIRARFLIVAPGILNLLKIPVIPGMETFQGAAFHSGRWDYGVTGGSPTDPNMTALADKVVAIVGTGGSAIQAVPPVGRSAAHTYVFQRTPSAVGVRGNAPTDPEFAASLAPGWQRERMENFTSYMAGKPVERNLVDDEWRLMASVANYRGEPGWSIDEIIEGAERFDYAVMEEHRRRVDEIVTDPRTAEGLKPYYRYLCKRPCFHDEYLAAFNDPKVTLVDCPAGVERVDEHGVYANGEYFEVDVIVYATGFEAEVTPFPRRAGHPIIGRDGLALKEKFANGAATLHGMMSRGFPNLFLAPGPGQQSVISVNHTHIMVSGADHISATIAQLDRMGVKIADVTEEAEADWVQKVVDGYADRSAFMSACTPSRLNWEGDPSMANPRNGSYGGGYGDYFGWRALLADWREHDFPGLELDGSTT